MRVKLIPVCLIILLMLLTNMVLAQSEPADLLVDATQDLGVINSFVYGANYGPPYAVHPDLFPQAASSGIRYLRMPAGRWGDDNFFRKDLVDFYHLQADMWGMEMAISVQLPGSGGTPEKAAELVRYTMEKGYDVRYWSIGNEPDLIAAYKTIQRLTNFADVRIDDYNRDWRLVAEAMLAVNPDIVFVGPDVSQFPYTSEGDPYTNVRREWVREFLKANGDLVDIVSVHRYPFPLTNTSSTTIEELQANPPQWEVLVENLRSVVQEATGKELPIAITEVNSHWSNTGGGEASPDSFYNAIWWADVLGRLIQHRLSIVTYFAFQSTGASGQFGLLDRYEVRPTYYVYQLYQRFGTQLVSSSSNDPDVSITAAIAPDNALTLMVVNRAAVEKSLSLSLTGFQPDELVEVWRFDSEHFAEPVDSINAGHELILPGQSITLYRLTQGG